MISVDTDSEVSRGVKSGHYIYFLLNGSLRVQSHGASLVIPSGHIVWLGAGVDREIWATGQSSWIILRLRNRLFAPGNGADQIAWRTLVQAGQLGLTSPDFPISHLAREKLFALARQILEATGSAQTVSLPRLKGLVLELLSVLETDAEFRSHAHLDAHLDPWAEQLQKVLLVIDEDIASVPDVPRLAERCGFSRSALYRILERAELPAPGVLLEQSRLDQAIRLLRSSDRTILSVVIDTGFGSVSAMYRAFERHYGKPPGAFRGARQAAQ